MSTASIRDQDYGSYGMCSVRGACARISARVSEL